MPRSTIPAGALLQAIKSMGGRNILGHSDSKIGNGEVVFKMFMIVSEETADDLRRALDRHKEME